MQEKDKLKKSGTAGKTAGVPESPKKKIAATKSKITAPAKKSPARPKGMKEWELRLYVAGMTPKALAAFTNLKRICEEHLKGEYRIEVIDLLRSPHLASGDQILAIPTLVRKLPPPIKKIIGDLSNEERVLIGLDIREIGVK